MARDITIRFLGDERDLTRASKNASNDLDRFAKRTGVIGGAVSAGVSIGIHALATGVRSAVGFMGDAIKQAEESARVAKVQAQLIKTTGGAAKTSAKQLGDYAEQLSNITGIDDEVISGAQNILLTFKQVRNETGKGNRIFDRATAAAADLSAVLGTDLNGSALQLGKALSNPVKGVTALQRAGVNFTDSQRKMIKALVDSGDVLGAQKIILGEVETQVGGAAEANATATQKMSTAWANFKEDLGRIVLPAFTSLVDVMTKTVLPAIEDFTSQSADKIKRWFRIISDAFSAGFDGKPLTDALDGIGGAVQKIARAGGEDFKKTVDVLKDLAEWAKDNKDPLLAAATALSTFATSLGAVATASKGASAIQSAVTGLGPAIAGLGATGPIGIAIAGVLALAAGVVVLYFKWKPFRQLVDETWQGMQGGADQAAKQLDQRLPPAINRVKDALRGASDAYVAFTSASESAVDFVTGLWRQFGDEISGIVSNAIIIAGAIVRTQVQILQNLGQATLGQIQVLWADIVGIYRAGAAIVTGIVKGFIAGVQQAWSSYGAFILGGTRLVWTSIRGVIEGALKIIEGAFAVFAGIITGSWSRTWGGVISIVSGAAQVIGNVLRGIVGAMEVFVAVSNAVLVGGFRVIVGAVNGLFTGIGRGLKPILDAVVSGFRSAINTIIDIINTAIRAYNRIPFLGDIGEINKVGRSSGGGGGGGGAFHPVMARGLALAAPAPAPAMGSTFGGTINVYLPTGASGHDVIDAQQRYIKRNGTPRWR